MTGTLQSLDATNSHMTDTLQFLNATNSHTTGTYLILQIPHSVPVRELLVRGAALGQDAALKAAHVEQEVGVVLAVHRHKAALPLDGGHRARQTVLDVPEHCASPENGTGKTSTFQVFIHNSLEIGVNRCFFLPAVF